MAAEEAPQEVSGSPFLEDEFRVRRADTKSDARMRLLEAESAFQHAFESVSPHRPLTEFEVMRVARKAGNTWGDELGNIDVYAQRSIVRLSRNALTAKDAHALLDAVRSRELRGIFVDNQRVPALRARKLGTWYWKLIPAGEDAVVVPAPTGSLEPSLIAFRDSVKAIASRLDAALVKARSEAVPRLIPASGTGGPRASADALERAVARFRRDIDDPGLVEEGQWHWGKLLKRAVRKNDPAPKIAASASGIINAVWTEYHRTGKPKTAAEMRAWFLQRYGRPPHAKDADALSSCEAKMCATTVINVLRLIKKKRSGVNWTKVWYDVCHQPGSRWKVEHGFCTIRKAVPKAVIEKLRKALSRGMVVRAGVLFGRACDRSNYCATKARSPGHFNLIIGHDDSNRFVYWNTVQPERHRPEWRGAFGVIDYVPDSGRLHVVRKAPDESHPILYLDTPW